MIAAVAVTVGAQSRVKPSPDSAVMIENLLGMVAENAPGFAAAKAALVPVPVQVAVPSGAATILPTTGKGTLPPSA